MEFNEKTIDRTVIYNGKIIDLEIHDVELPDGQTSKRELIYHNGAVAICAVTPENEVLLVKQFSDFKSADAQFDFNLVTGNTEQRLGQLCFLVCQAFESDINYSLKLPNKLIASNSGKLHHQRCLQALSQVGNDNE